MKRKFVTLALVAMLLPAASFARGPVISTTKKGPIVSEPKVVEASATNPLFDAAAWLWEIVTPKPPKMN